MLTLTAFELIVRLIPEAFIFIFATYVFSNTKLDAKRYINSSVLLGICIYFVRKLPIDYGVHTILNIILQTVIVAGISKISIAKAIKSAIVSALCLFILEAFNILILSLIFKEELEAIMLNPTAKIIYGSPSLICFVVIIMICYHVNKRGKIKND